MKTSNKGEKKDHYFSKTLEKGLITLSLFGDPNLSWGLSQIARVIGTSKTSAYRIVNTLVSLGYLRKDPKTKALGVGAKAIYLSSILRGQFDLFQIIRPLIDDMHSKFNVTVDSAVLADDTMMSLYRVEAKETLVLRLPVMIKEIHSVALGKAALAFLPDDEMREMVNRLELTKRTKNTIISKERLISELNRTRERGYSLNNEEFIPGLISVGAPLLSSESKRPIGAVSIDSSTVEHRVDFFERKYSVLVKDLSLAVSKAIP
jgi:DNA-binding IclR family transcriptional regulator